VAVVSLEAVHVAVDGRFDVVCSDSVSPIPTLADQESAFERVALHGSLSPVAKKGARKWRGT
jgi:hypothetical protein